MIKHLKNRIIAFRKDEEGTITAEAVTMFPLLFATVIAMFVFFDAFRHQSINLKAAYTISDAISREQETIDNNFIVNSWRLHRLLSQSPGLTQLQISLIQYHEDTEEHRVVWSQARGGFQSLTNGALETLVTDGRIPVIPDEETLILVQTSVNYTPAFSVGLGSFNFENLIFTRPRFTAQLCYSASGSVDNRVCPINS